MFGFLTLLGNEKVDPFRDADALEAFWRALPQGDPLAAQKAVCAALAEPVWTGSDRKRPSLLLALDQKAQGLVEDLLQAFASKTSPADAQGLQSWQAAFELSRSFGRAFGQILKGVADDPGFQGWNERLPYATLRYLQHRQAELLLRPFVDERSTRFPWKELHDTHRFAQSRSLAGEVLPVNRRNSPNAADTTLEREYIHLLLQDLMNAGHFPPLDALWVSEAIPRWSGATVLKPRPDPLVGAGFVVDLDSDSGIARSSGAIAESCFCLDTSPVRKAMRDEFEVLRDAPDRPGEGSWLGHGQRRRILAKLNVICANERPVIVRRGERKPTALTVDVVVGLAPILAKLRSEAREAVMTVERAAAMGDEVTVTAFGGLSEPTGTGTDAQGAGVQPAHPPLTMVDRSDSGCRLQGPTHGATPIVPGSLLAIREGAGSPWTLAVVRRLKKRLAGKRIEIGVEYLGRDPRRVVVVAPEADAAAAGTSARFAALYLAEGTKFPALPMKSLVLPARAFAAEACLSVRSRTDVYEIQLKEPLDEQAEFVWAPFTIIEHQPAPPRAD